MGCDPPRLVCGRSVFRGRPGCRGLAAGSVREPAAKDLRDDGLTRAGAGLSGGSWDRLLGLRLGFNRSERLIAQFTEDVVGAAAAFAGDREAGPVVVDARVFVSRTDEHECSRIVELVECLFDCASVARAVESDREGRGRPPLL